VDFQGHSNLNNDEVSYLGTTCTKATWLSADYQLYQ